MTVRAALTALCLLLAAANQAAAGDAQGSLVYEGLKRTYLVHVPPSYDTSQPYPVVLVFHGGGGRARAVDEATGFNAAADRHGFLAVYPQGEGPSLFGRVFGTWNAGRCCGRAMKQQIDDVGFVSRLIEKLEGDYRVDSRRIYATGISNGAQMSFRLACDLSERVAAIGPAGAQGVIDDCQPKRPVPVIYFHGTADPCSPFSGGQAGGCFEQYTEKLLRAREGPPSYSWAVPPAPEYAVQWAKRNAVAGQPQETFRQGKTVCQTWGQGQPGEVTFCSIDGMGHVWPGHGYGAPCRKPTSARCRLYRQTVGPASRDIDANEAMWAFFERHPMSR